MFLHFKLHKQQVSISEDSPMVAKKKEGCFIYQYHGTTKVTDSSLLELPEANNPCT